MIRAFYGIETNPFSHDQDITLLKHQQEVFDILKVHSHQGGFCMLMGEPGTGKTIIITIDDAHLMEMNILRKFRLLFEDFPKNHKSRQSSQSPTLDRVTIGC